MQPRDHMYGCLDTYSSNFASLRLACTKSDAERESLLYVASIHLRNGCPKMDEVMQNETGVCR